MRSDMDRVLVERPRHNRPRPGRGLSFPRGSKKNWAGRDLECTPSREGMRRVHHDWRKWPSENFAPLRRYLRSNVGRPWSKVHAEIRAQLRGGTTMQQHVLQHLWDFVVRRPIMKDGVAHDVRPFWGKRLLESQEKWPRFYVCPRTGLLREAPRARRPPPVPSDLGRRVLSPTLELQRLAGVWFEVELAPWGAENARAVLRKRQLDSRTIRRLGLSRSD
jgi:hypothetical protein